jgi:hypothetical protein
MNNKEIHKFKYFPLKNKVKFERYLHFTCDCLYVGYKIGSNPFCVKRDLPNGHYYIKENQIGFYYHYVKLGNIWIYNRMKISKKIIESLINSTKPDIKIRLQIYKELK